MTIKNVKKGWKDIPIGGVIVEPKTSLRNKTGNWRVQKPIFHPERCIHCMLCVPYCPEDAFIVEDGKLKGINYDYCKGCGLCASVCPVKAITMEDENVEQENDEK